jgi:MFS family permease
MDSTLRPLSTSQLLDRTFFLYRKNFVLFAGVGAIAPTLLVLMQFGFAALGFPPQPGRRRASSPEQVLVLALLWFICYMLAAVIGNAIASGATVHAVSRTHMGEPVTIVESYKKVLSRLGTVLLIILMVFVCQSFVGGAGGGIAGVLAAVVIPALSGGSGGAIALMVIAIVVAVSIAVFGMLAGFYFYFRFSLSVPAAIVEGIGPVKAMKRSFWLANGSIVRIFLLYLLAWALAFGLTLVFAIPAQILATVLVLKKSFLIALVVQQLGSFIAGVLAAPIAPIAVSLVYYDQRIRKEAFDLQLMMQSIDQAAPLQTAVAAPPIG